MLAYRLCGAERPPSRKNPGCPGRAASSRSPARALVTPALPPDQTKTGSLRLPSRLTSWVRPGADRADRVGVHRVEHGGEPRRPALDDLLVHDVGLVEPGLRLGVDVVDLDDHRRPRRVRRRVGDGTPVKRVREPPRWSSSGPPWSVGRRRCRRRARWSSVAAVVAGPPWSPAPWSPAPVVGGSRGCQRRRGDGGRGASHRPARGRIARERRGVLFMGLQLFQQGDPLLEGRMRVKQSVQRP